MNNTETVKELARAIKTLAESIQYTELHGNLTLEHYTKLLNIVIDMETLLEEVDENE